VCVTALVLVLVLVLVTVLVLVLAPVPVHACTQAHAPLCDTLGALLLRARRDGECAPRAVLAMEHMEPLEAEVEAEAEAEACGTGGQTDSAGQIGGGQTVGGGRTGGRFFRDRGLEDFRAVAAARGLALRWCPLVPTAGAGAGSASQAGVASPPEIAGDAPGSPPESPPVPEFTWPLEAFSDARPFVVELVLAAEAPGTEPGSGPF